MVKEGVKRTELIIKNPTTRKKKTLGISALAADGSHQTVQPSGGKR